MTPKEFVKTKAWKHIRDDVRWEVLAVVLPVVIYAFSLAVADFGLREHFAATDKTPRFVHLLGVPDGLFGGCILFAFALIQGYRYRETHRGTESVAYDRICAWRQFGVVGLVGSTVLSAVAVMFHPSWALAAGLASVYTGALTYKKVMFFRTYLDALNAHRLSHD